MDTGSILLRMLRLCRSRAETAAERAEVAWWRSQIEALHEQQPVTDTAPPPQLGLKLSTKAKTKAPCTEQPKAAP